METAGTVSNDKNVGDADSLDVQLASALAANIRMSEQLQLAEQSAHIAREKAAEAIQRYESLSDSAQRDAAALVTLRSTKLFRWTAGVRSIYSRTRN